eukprot:12923274-Alexandrium_andersonii.AAC.1
MQEECWPSRPAWSHLPRVARCDLLMGSGQTAGSGTTTLRLRRATAWRPLRGRGSEARQLATSCRTHCYPTKAGCPYS